MSDPDRPVDAPPGSTADASHGTSRLPSRASAGATSCDACLRHAWLVARLAGWLELARHGRAGRLREVLALPAGALLEALVPERERAAVTAELRAAGLPRAIRSACAAAGQVAVCRHDDAYPSRVHDLGDAPAVLFALASGGGAAAAAARAASPRDPVAQLAELAGGDADLGPPAVAVVGTRRASPDGIEVARGLGRGLAAAGVTVVSGMALGIDAAAHAGALDAGGRTIAVLACGADVAYPRSKSALHAAIRDAGLVVSELPPGTGPRRWCFPARNRTIAALARMTVVVEAATRSGSLITAELAADLGREVGAVPGPVTSWRADGTNALLRDGATLVRHAADVLDAAVGLDRPRADPAAALEPRLLTTLRAVAGGRDTLGALAGGPDQVDRTLRDLTDLELRGLLRRVPGGRYVVVPQ